MDPKLIALQIEINEWAEREQELQWVQQFCQQEGLVWRVFEWMKKKCEARRLKCIEERNKLRQM
jgi:hypothetical protein